MPRLLNLADTHQPLVRLLDEQLEQVALIFERQLASDLSAVNRLCMHIEQYRGKMLRPTLVLLCGLAASERPSENNENGTDGGLDEKSSKSGGGTESHRVIAAVVEMIHMATLVHDDVLDEADVRRGGATVNHLWGNEAAVILGDYLISNAFHLCSTIQQPAINLALGQVTNVLCEGELVQLHHRNDCALDEESYLEIIQRKTASLIGECCRLGAMLSGANEKICQALLRYGQNLGIAFQIQDDLLDLIGQEAVVGKSLGKDLAKGKITLPLIYYLADAGQRERGRGLQLIGEGDAEALRTVLIESGAVERTEQTARRIAAQAGAQLQSLTESPARALLAAFAVNVVNRDC